jgi:heme/copper-type cytochrome/quinol oxidase subunit 1
MPRRIPDYPDAYSSWNFIASFGSYLSVLSLVVFLFTIFYAFTISSEEKIVTSTRIINYL